MEWPATLSRHASEGGLSALGEVGGSGGFDGGGRGGGRESGYDVSGFEERERRDGRGGIEAGDAEVEGNGATSAAGVMGRTRFVLSQTAGGGAQPSTSRPPIPAPVPPQRPTRPPPPPLELSAKAINPSRQNGVAPPSASPSPPETAPNHLPPLDTGEAVKEGSTALQNWDVKLELESQLSKATGVQAMDEVLQDPSASPSSPSHRTGS